MAALAIDVVDVNWRLLQGMEKPLTRHGARLLRCNPRRARGDGCYDREPRGEGPRIIALERVIRRDTQIEDGELEPDEIPQLVVGYRQCAVRWTKLRRKAEVRELLEEERTEMLAIEDELRRAREGIPDIHARRRFLKDFIKFLEGQTLGLKDRIILNESRLELEELNLLVMY